jgi:hypothetical protein
MAKLLTVPILVDDAGDVTRLEPRKLSFGKSRIDVVLAGVRIGSVSISQAGLWRLLTQKQPAYLEADVARQEAALAVLLLGCDKDLRKSLRDVVAARISKPVRFGLVGRPSKSYEPAVQQDFCAATCGPRRCPRHAEPSCAS